LKLLPAKLCPRNGNVIGHAGERTPHLVRNIFTLKCHGLFALRLLPRLLLLTGLAPVWAQSPAFLPPPAPPPAQTPNPSNPNVPYKIPHPEAPDINHVIIGAIAQETNGPWRLLRGKARVETADTLLEADEIDYNSDTGDVIVRGNVLYQSYLTGNKIHCDHGDYNVDTENGHFYDVTGESPSKVQVRPGILSTSNPFYFQAKWVDRIADRYILHQGFITNCKMPDPWWTLSGPKFDIISQERAIAYRAVFRLRNIPLFYLPTFYKPLGKQPRKSGFLAPNLGIASQRGFMYGIGYYWAINRSYDLLYRPVYFSQRGLSNYADLRGKVHPGTDFDLQVYGVQDRGIMIGNTLQKQGGYEIDFVGRTDLGDGWEGRADVDYLSSYLFRQNFTEIFNQAIFSESHSVGFIDKQWSTFGLTFVAERDVNYLNINPKDTIVVRTLPSAEFVSSEHLLSDRWLPVWFSLDSSASGLNRSQPGGTSPAAYVGELDTVAFVPRLDAEPSVTTAFHWEGFSIMPTFTGHETFYGAEFNQNTGFVAKDFVRSAADFDLVLIPPSFARVFNAPKFLGKKLKHVIEPRIEFRGISGIGRTFNQVPRFDEIDLLADTEQLNLSIANRFYIKQKDGSVKELAYWEIRQDRYFNPTFGGAVQPGRLNIIDPAEDLTAFPFLAGPRTYSPIDSDLRLLTRIGLEWRADYDPLIGHLTDSGISVDYRLSNFFFALGHNEIRDNPILITNSNQISTTVGYGSTNRKGLSGAMSIYYDYDRHVLEFITTQMTYNTDCCGITVQFRRFAFGTRNQNEFLVSFGVSNVSSFGTLRRQDRLF
jgi:LPS-assembly protein